MIEPIKAAISIDKALFDQVEILAQQLNISQSRLCEIAIEAHIENLRTQTSTHKQNKEKLDPHEYADSSDQDETAATQLGRGRTVINQGDIYWVHVGESSGTDLGYYPHPYVVLQDTIVNQSRISTVVVCALTSNIKLAKEPGNVLLEVGEANLPKHSVVVVSKISTVDKTQLGEYIGSLTKKRIVQIFAGMQFLYLAFFAR